MIAYVNLLLTLASAVLLAASLPNELFPWGVTLTGLVSLVPILLVVYRASDRRTACRWGALFGAVSTALANYWLAFFGDFAVWTIGGPVIGYTVYNYMLFGFLHRIAHPTEVRSEPRRLAAPHRHDMRPLQIAVAWTAYELLKSVGFLGYPWGLVAYPLARWNAVAQIAELGGVWGLSFLAAYTNAAVAELVAARDNPRRTRPRRPPATAARILREHMRGLIRMDSHAPIPRHLAVAILLIASAGVYGVRRLSHIEPVDTIDIVLVQQNVDSWQPGRFGDALDAAQRLTLAGLADAEDAGRSPEAVVWSETALRRPYMGPSEFYETVPPALPFTDFLALIDLPLVTGAPMPAYLGSRDALNSALVIEPSGELSGMYGKQQLVPFAESIPFWDRPVVQRFFREVVGLHGTWVPGRESSLLTIRRADGTHLAIGTPICFEDAFGWVPREMVRGGADLLVNLTNNSWSRQESAQTQHYVAARLRTIELRTSLVRGTNSGLSTVVDARGIASQSLPMFESASAVVSVPLYGTQWTLYRAWGDWLGWVAVILTFGKVIRDALLRRRPR
ncbi:MAG: apolipoprotein N-acyltransferase [Spirochaetales bacterium]|nr:apolipoprotein N-acyltransferase [Spirochaetales bacterium]